MSDFGNLYAYALELEAQIPPATLLAMKSRPLTMPELPDPNAKKAEATPAPAAHADDKTKK